MGNIVLIGMPGSGKTSVGRLLAEELKVPFLDTDQMIEQEQNRTISEIFAAEGEAYFRDLETGTARHAAQYDGAVISTGGGMILRPENMAALGETGTIFFIDRPPEDIAGGNLTDRPLIGENRERIFALYRNRIELYRRYADYVIENRDSSRRCTEEIMRIWKEGTCS